MFSDGRAPASGEQRAFKPHAPHFIPWLRNSLKPHHGSDLELNGPYKSKAEVRGGLTPLERAKGIGIFSIQGRDKAKKSELRCNGVGMARMLPVMLRGHHILPGGLGRQKEGSPARGKPPPEPDADPGARGPDSSPAQGKRGGQDGTGTPGRKYGPLVGPPAVAVLAAEPDLKAPVVVCMEDRRGKVWDYSNHTIRQRDLHSSSWVGSDSQGLVDRQHGFASSFSYISRNSQSQRDLTALREPPVEALSSPLNGVIFSTEVPPRGLGYTTTLQGPRKRGPSAKHIAALGHSQTWVPHRTAGGAESHRNGAGWNRKVVRNQIKKVVDNLEQVLTALRDVHQEMKEVVEQIDQLTSSIDLNEEDQQQVGGGDSSSTSGSSSSEVTVGSVHRRPSEPREHPGTLRRDHRTRGQSPPNVLLCPLTSERTQTLRFSCSLGLSTRQEGPPINHLASASLTTKSTNSPQFSNFTAHDLTLSPQRILPVRPPTPGLSPLTVNLHPPNSPGSSPRSPGASSSVMVTPSSPLSPRRQPPPTLSPSVIIETPQSEQSSAAPLCPSLTRSPSASCPPADSETRDASHAVRERRASSAGPTHRPSQLCAAPAADAPTKSSLVQGRRGRKPPPYPHHRLSDHTETAKESRKAPPYPEKRRLLSTTV